jgi:hypothetical protein
VISGLGYVRISSFLPSYYVCCGGELWMFGGGEMLCCDPHIDQSSKSFDLATANFIIMMVPFGA